MKRTDFQEEITLREMLAELERQNCKEITRIRLSDDAGMVIVEWD